MSYVSHQSIGYSQKLESPILHNILCLVFTEKGNWSIKKKKSPLKLILRTWKKVNWNIRDSKFRNTQLIDEKPTTLILFVF